jgi:hypothetical protein
MPTPQPNLGSPAFVGLVQAQLQQVLTAIRGWYNNVSVADAQFLRGIKIAEEIDVGANYYFYPNGNDIYDTWPHTSAHDPTYGLNFAKKGMWGGLSPMGYAMRYSLTNSTASSAPDGSEIGRGIKTFIATIASTIRATWPEKSQLSDRFFAVHLGHSGDGFIPWSSNMVPPFLPAYSFYPSGQTAAVPVQESLLQSLGEYMPDGCYLVVGEWFCFDCQSKEDWASAFHNIFTAFEGSSGCQVEEVRVYNLDSFVASNGAVEGLHMFLEETNHPDGG